MDTPENTEPHITTDESWVLRPSSDVEQRLDALMLAGRTRYESDALPGFRAVLQELAPADQQALWDPICAVLPAEEPGLTLEQISHRITEDTTTADVWAALRLLVADQTVTPHVTENTTVTYTAAPLHHP